MQKIVILFIIWFIPTFLFAAEVETWRAASQTETTPSGIPISEIGNRIEHLVATYMHDITPGLAVAVVKDGEIVFSQGFGYAQLEQRISVDPAVTVFEYGSISKLFVYISVMQLVERGKLNLDADIHTYLPEDLSRRFNFKQTFTIRDLLNHSAGFGENFFNAFQDPEKVENQTTLRDGLINSQPKQVFKPGTASSYSNFGSALLAYVVSHISQQEFAIWERENILDPLGMTNALNQPHWFKNQQFLQNKALGYQPDRKGGFNEAAWWYIPMYPAGAMNGTVEHLAHLAIALTPPHDDPGTLFKSRATLDKMLSPSYADRKQMRGMYHGFFRYDGIYPTFGHGGGTGGFGSELAVVPSERFGVVVLTNSVVGMTINAKILDLLLGNGSTTIQPTSNLPNAATVAGNYVLFRRHTGNVVEPLNFILGTNLRVDAIDENTLNLNVMGMTLTYRQVEPYVFRLISADSGIAHTIPEIYFTPEGRILMGAFSAERQTFRQSMPFFIVCMAVVLISALFFLITPVILLFRFLLALRAAHVKSKDKTTSTFNYLSNGLLIVGTLFSLNYIFSVLRVAEANVFMQTSIVTPHIWLNYILLVIAIALIVASQMRLKKDNITLMGKKYYYLIVSLLAFFTLVMLNWNYFVMH